MPQHKARKKDAQDDAPGDDDPTPERAPSPQQLTYIQVLLETIMDNRMSAKALGLLVIGLARQSIPRDRLPGKWQFYQSEIAQNFTDGVSSINTGLQELQTLGYAKYQKNPRQAGKFQGGNYVFHDRSASTPAWPPPRAATGTGSTQSAQGKTASGKTARGKSPTIQLKSPAQSAECYTGDPGSPVASNGEFQERAIRGASLTSQRQEKNAAPVEIHDMLQALLAKAQLPADSEDGQALILKVEAALHGPGASQVSAALKRAQGSKVRNPAAYLAKTLSQLEQAPSTQVLDVAALRDRVLNRQLRVNGELTPRVQDVLGGSWPSVVFVDGTELELSKLNNYEVIE